MLVSDEKAARASLKRRILKWRKVQLSTMPSVANMITENEAMREDVENLDLLLPSSFPSEDREQLQLTSMARIEYRLREGEAHDALDNLRIALRFLAVMDHKRKSGTTFGMRTRSRKEEIEAKANKAIWVSEYRSIRDILMTLGMDEDDTVLKVLTDEDCWRPDISAPNNFREGKKVPGWIWTINRRKGPDDDDEWLKEGLQPIERVCWCTAEYIIPDDRVAWFRSRALRDRWKEEVAILEAEMGRLVRGLDGMSKIWAQMAADAMTMDRKGAAAYAYRKEWVYACMASYTRRMTTSLRTSDDTASASASDWDGARETIGAGDTLPKKMRMR